MPKIKLLSKYPRIDLSEGEINFEAEKQWSDRPAWIKLTNVKKPYPRFLSVQVPKHGELIYKSFGHYYYPFDYTNEEECRFMNGMAEEYDSIVGTEFNTPMAKMLLSKLPLAKINKNAKILDLGCGTGIISEILVNEGYCHLTLIDFSQRALAVAKQKPILKNAIFRQIDVTKELPTGKFDLVVSVMLFNTFDEQTTDSIISKLISKLNPNAIFAILEDTPKHCYQKYFESIYEGMVNIANRTKYVFVGKLKH